MDQRYHPGHQVEQMQAGEQDKRRAHDERVQRQIDKEPGLILDTKPFLCESGLT